MKEVSRINEYEKTEKILKALGSKPRLQILECIQRGISRADEIARRLKRHRSTIDQHLNVLSAAKIVKKVSSLGRNGQPTIRYEMQENAKTLLVMIQKMSQSF